MGDEGDPDRDAILRRRRRFVAVALGALATGAACGEPQVCLSIAIDAGPAADGGDASVPDGSIPTPCLSMVPPDGGQRDGATGSDSGVIGLDGAIIPMPCLSMVPPDSGAEES